MKNKLHKLLNMPSGVFTVHELKVLLLLVGATETDLNEGYLKIIDTIYERLRNLPKEQGGLEGGYRY